MNSTYDEIADWYDSVVRAGAIVQDAALRALQDLSGEVRNLHICDLACGQGYAARAFADRGAKIIGVDISSKLLDIARADELACCRGIQYAEMDAETLVDLSGSCFDGVFCNLALMDIGDLAATSASVYRVLQNGGWFAFTILHPCFQTSHSAWVTEANNTGRLVRAYFDEGRWHSCKVGMRARVGAVHRTLSSYFNTLTSAGFALEAVAEPRLCREPGKFEPAYDEIPALLAARFIKR